MSTKTTTRGTPIKPSAVKTSAPPGTNLFAQWYKYLLDFLKDLLSLPYRLLVHVICNFLADVLEHPRVQEATAQAIARGMNISMEDPNLPRRAARLYIQLQEDSDMSRQLGEQFPKVAANFIAGAASSLKRSASFSKLTRRDKDKDKDKENNNTHRPSSPVATDSATTATADTDQQSLASKSPVPSETEVVALVTPKTGTKEEAIIKLSFPWTSAFSRVDASAESKSPQQT